MSIKALMPLTRQTSHSPPSSPALAPSNIKSASLIKNASKAVTTLPKVVVQEVKHTVILDYVKTYVTKSQHKNLLSFDLVIEHLKTKYDPLRIDEMHLEILETLKNIQLKVLNPSLKIWARNITEDGTRELEATPRLVMDFKEYILKQLEGKVIPGVLNQMDEALSNALYNELRHLRNFPSQSKAEKTVQAYLEPYMSGEITEETENKEREPLMDTILRGAHSKIRRQVEEKAFQKYLEVAVKGFLPHLQTTYTQDFDFLIHNRLSDRVLCEIFDNNELAEIKEIADNDEYSNALKLLVLKTIFNYLNEHTYKGVKEAVSEIVKKDLQAKNVTSISREKLDLLITPKLLSLLDIFYKTHEEIKEDNDAVLNKMLEDKNLQAALGKDSVKMLRKLIEIAIEIIPQANQLTTIIDDGQDFFNNAREKTPGVIPGAKALERIIMQQDLNDQVFVQNLMYALIPAIKRDFPQKSISEEDLEKELFEAIDRVKSRSELDLYLDNEEAENIEISNEAADFLRKKNIPFESLLIKTHGTIVKFIDADKVNNALAEFRMIELVKAQRQHVDYLVANKQPISKAILDADINYVSELYTLREISDIKYIKYFLSLVDNGYKTKEEVEKYIDLATGV